jgi:hypothetical protein
LVHGTGLVLVLHVADEALNTFRGEESISSHDVVYLGSSHVNHFQEFFNIDGVEHGHVVGAHISLVEQTHNLGLVQTRVAVIVESTFGSSHEVHAQVHHAFVVNSAR